jgi:hypothetical protein
MTKYIIEGNIDFYSELYKSLDDDQDNNESTNLCLISDKPLIENFVQMECGHKFNYLPLFLDIKNHKQKFNGLEESSSKLHADEIRCPYCRNKQKGVLPYYEEIGIPKIHGVNYINANFINNDVSKYKPCQFLTENDAYDPSGNNPVEFGIFNKDNCKLVKCLHLGTQIIENQGPELGINAYGDAKHYCWFHKKIVVKKYKKAIVDASKEEIKQAKLKAKEEKLAAKEKEKQEKLNKKNQKYTQVVDAVGENVVIGYIEGCGVILKTGANKGNPCGCKIFENTMCKRHNDLNNKKNQTHV